MRQRFSAIEHTALLNDLRSGSGIAARHYRLQKTMREFWSRMQNDPTMVFALVATLAPDAEDMHSAYDAAQDRIERLIHEVMLIVSSTELVCAGERNRLRPLVEYGSHRRIEIEGERKKLEKLLERGAGEDVLARRAKMRNAGVPDSEADRLVPMPDRDELRAQIAALDAEAKAINEFVRTDDESHLPADFAERAQAYHALRQQMRTINTPSLAVMGP